VPASGLLDADFPFFEAESTGTHIIILVINIIIMIIISSIITGEFDANTLFTLT
jgi:hypothetical protein